DRIINGAQWRRGFSRLKSRRCGYGRFEAGARQARLPFASNQPTIMEGMMVKRSNWAMGILALVALTMITRTSMADPGLTGPGRNNFVESSFQTCFQEARSNPVNRATDVATLAQYCVCFSNEMADRLANDDLKALDAAVATD